MKPHIFECDFAPGETVYFRLDTDPAPGLVTGINIDANGARYLVTWPDKVERMHYALELARTPSYAAEPGPE